jgi:hypothetical protein
MDGLTFRQANFSDIGELTQFFPFEPPTLTVPDDTLLVHIRAGDVAALSHHLYGPLPISYYKHLHEMTGLNLAFIGELEDTDYIRSLRRALPRADFLNGGTPREDFQTIRSAKNVAIAVSTFSWMASYLSRAARNIHLPLAGLFDPLQSPKTDFIPSKDKRFIVHAIPRQAWRKRYDDFNETKHQFRMVSKVEIATLKLSATIRTTPRSARIHLGLLRRMIASTR